MHRGLVFYACACVDVYCMEVELTTHHALWEHVAYSDVPLMHEEPASLNIAYEAPYKDEERRLRHSLSALPIYPPSCSTTFRRSHVGRHTRAKSARSVLNMASLVSLIEVSMCVLGYTDTQMVDNNGEENGRRGQLPTVI